MKQKRIVITGRGCITSLGDTLEGFYQSLLQGKSSITRWQSIDVNGLECKIGGDLGHYDTATALANYLDNFEMTRRKKIKKLFNRTTFSAKIAMLSSLAAYKESGLLEKPPLDSYRIAAPVAGHNFNSNYIFRNFKQFLQEPEYIEPMCSVDAIDPNLPAVISEMLNINGPSFCLGGACASGNLALREAMHTLHAGEVDVAVVVGPPFDVAPPDLQASVILNAVVVKPYFQDHPAEASRPFDRDRCGFIYSHGGASLVLETLEHAEKRGATIYGELLAVAANANANHLPMPGVENQVKVMQNVIQQAGIQREEVDYINCHATSTPDGDVQEIRALKKVFGDHIYQAKLNAPKSLLGHTCWASPLVETVAGLLQMEHGVLHPTINLHNPDPEVAGIDLCANQSEPHHINYMLKNSFGFGGINCCTLIKNFS